MIELTPLDVRKKRGDFSKGMRGYAVQEVDAFLEDVAARLEELVKENLRLSDRVELLQASVTASEGREKAVQEALVTAQELRADVRAQADREAELRMREAASRIEQMVAEADQLVQERRSAVEELERQRTRFLKSFRTLLERELDAVEVEEARAPLEDITVELNLGEWSAAPALDSADEPQEEEDVDGDEDEDEPAAEAEATFEEDLDMDAEEDEEDGLDVESLDDEVFHADEFEETDDGPDSLESVDVEDEPASDEDVPIESVIDDDEGGPLPTRAFPTTEDGGERPLWLYDLDEKGKRD